MPEATDDGQEYAYPGDELALFAHALRWKSYLRAQITPWIGQRVLEVGAGIGETTRHLCVAPHERWVCAEPDPGQVEVLRRNLALHPPPIQPEVFVGESGSLPPDERFDTILYIDVLEHIEDDRAELLAVARRLEPGGRLVVLSPAHGWLFTPFDAAIGHHRRYTARTLRAVIPPGLREERVLYMDAVGMLASLGNKLLLRSSNPTYGQIAFWDGVLVPCSRLLDPLLLRRVGRSVLGVWRRD